jgi:hypothetical protein
LGSNRVSIQFGVEVAFQSLTAKLFTPSEFTEGTKSIQINGLVWMGEAAYEATNRRKISRRIYCV